MSKVFIIEDDFKIRTELAVLLSKYGYEGVFPSDFKSILDDIFIFNPKLILLDINLPYFDGYYICREIRKKSNVPIIVVTSRNSDIDELMSMNLGADDFIVKPYNTSILLARIESVLRRTNGDGQKQQISLNDLYLDTSKCIASYQDKQTELSKNEFKILYMLMKNSGRIISRDEIMNELWQSDEFVDDNTLTVNINRLRKKLEEIGIKDFLITKRGQGYMV